MAGMKFVYFRETIPLNANPKMPQTHRPQKQTSLYQRQDWRQSPEFLEIPAKRKVIGILLGVGYALSLYFFLQIFRESLRVFPSLLEDSLWELTPAEDQYYNWIYAALSVLMGRGVMWNYWLERPRRFLAKNNRKRYSILTDHRILWASFLWFTRSGYAFFVVLGIAFSHGFEELSFYEDFWFLFPLMMVVFYLQSWNSLRKIYRRKVWKRFGLATFVLLIFTWILTLLNPVDPSATNKAIKDQNPVLSLEIKLPQSDFGKRVRRISLIKPVYVSQGERGTEFLVDKKVVSLKELTALLNEWRINTFIYEQPLLAIQVYADGSIPMEDIHALQVAAARARIGEIKWAVTEESNGKRRVPYTNVFLHQKNPQWPQAFLVYSINNNIPLPPDREYILPPVLEIDSSRCFFLEISPGKTSAIFELVSPNRRVEVAMEDLSKALRDSLWHHPKHDLVYKPHPLITFEDYLGGIEAHKSAVKALRKQYTLDRYKVTQEQMHEMGILRYGDDPSEAVEAYPTSRKEIWDDRDTKAYQFMRQILRDTAVIRNPASIILPSRKGCFWSPPFFSGKSLDEYYAELLQTDEIEHIKRERWNRSQMDMNAFSKDGFIIFDVGPYLDREITSEEFYRKQDSVAAYHGFNHFNLVSFRGPYFNPEENLALVEFTYYEPFGSSGQSLLFEKVKDNNETAHSKGNVGQWRIVGSVEDWVE